MKRKFNLDHLVRDNVKVLKPYSSARSEFTTAVEARTIFLDANENPFESGLNRYPDPQQRSLKTLLASQKGVAEAQILLGNGSDEVLDLLVRAFCEPNMDNIITLPPTYGMYKVLADTNAVENREVVLTSGFEPDVSAIQRATDAGSKILFLCSPNNPTGNIFSEESIKTLLEHFTGLVVIDEAYIDFSEKESWITRLSTYPNLVITQTLSKAYGMAGIRLGIGYASEEIIAVLNKIKPPYNINELTQRMGLKRLNDIDLVKEETNIIIEAKRILFKVLLHVNFVKEVYPSEANFLLVKVDDAALRYRQLIDNGVVVRNRSRMPLCKNTLRLTIGTPEENLQLIKTLNYLA